jgi:hypothetical protein
VNQPKPYRPSYGAGAQPQVPPARPTPTGAGSAAFPPPSAPPPSQPGYSQPLSYPQPPSEPPPQLPAYQQGYPQQQFAPGFQQQEPKATTALVLGLVGLFCLGALTGVPAIIVGRGSKRAIDASNGQLGGRGKAVAGEVLGWISVGWMIFWVLLMILSLAAR